MGFEGTYSVNGMGILPDTSTSTTGAGSFDGALYLDYSPEGDVGHRGGLRSHGMSISKFEMFNKSAEGQLFFEGMGVGNSRRRNNYEDGPQIDKARLCINLAM